MSPLLVAVLAWAAAGADGAPATPPPASVAAPSIESTQSGPALREAIHDALRRWAQPTDEQAEEAAREFLTLYEQLRRDGQLASSQREYLRTKLRHRLLRLSDQISSQVAWDKPGAETEGPASVSVPEGKGGPLAQQIGAFGPHPPPGMMGQAGPQAMPRGFGRAAPRTDDYGPALVELIQRTIRPETWDVNGGRGTIYYWYPGRALVIRQMGEVHDEVGAVLGQLQRMGR